MIVYLARDTVGLPPMLDPQALLNAVAELVGGLAAVETLRHVGGWWRSEERVVQKLVESLAAPMVMATVVTVPTYPVEDLDPLIEIAFGIEGVPDGAFITKAKDVAPLCQRCGHRACPCCTDWCDQCLRDVNDERDAEGTLDGLVWRYPDGTTTHADCAADSMCDYPATTDEQDAARTVSQRAVMAASSTRWPGGGSFGVTDDGRVWFGPHDDIDKLDDKALSDDERAVLRARVLVGYADSGGNYRSMRIDSDVLRGMLHLLDRVDARIGLHREKCPRTTDAAANCFCPTQLEASLRTILKPQEHESIEAAARRLMDDLKRANRMLETDTGMAPKIPVIGGLADDPEESE